MKSFFTLLIILISTTVFGIDSSERSSTTVIDNKAYCIGEELATQKSNEDLKIERLKINNLKSSNLESYNRFLDWTLVDSLRITGALGPDQRLAFSFDQTADTLESYFSLDSLPSICQQAVAYAPTWIKQELISAFWRLGDSAEFYAQILLNAPANYADEIAFCIAKMGPEVLIHRLFNPDLLLENVTWLYQIDDSIQYANIVDYGSPPGDYYSTVQYCIIHQGDTVWAEYPREIYYYFIVHPTTSDEIPRLDDYVYNKHWREYFFFEADSGYPILGDYIKQARVVWSRTREVLQRGRPFTPTDGALDIVGNWVTRTNVSGATGNRPIHPNVIAHEHNGNCGEIQDLWTAACRTCLIPAVNCSDPCEDHVWNEFFDVQWYPLASDPATHIADSGVAYDEQYGGSKQVSACWNWRPDGYWWTVTGHFSNSCSLYVDVYDQLGIPIDGARVIISSEFWYGGLSTTAIGFTDRMGRVGFELGDLRNYYARITTRFGDYPPDPNATVKIINVSQSNARYYKSFYLYTPIPAPRPRPENFFGDSLVVHRMSMDLNMPSRLEFGYCISRGSGTGDPEDSVRFYQFYADKQNSGITDFYITNPNGYNNYLAQTRFGALLLGDDIMSNTFDFICPDTAKYYAIISNEDRAYASNWLDFNLKLYVQTLSSITQDNQILTNTKWSTASLVKGRIRIKLNGINIHSPPEFQLFNASGEKVTKGLKIETKVENELSLNVEALPAGIYFLKLASGNSIQTKKIALIK